MISTFGFRVTSRHAERDYGSRLQDCRPFDFLVLLEERDGDFVCVFVCFSPGTHVHLRFCRLSLSIFTGFLLFILLLMVTSVDG